MNSLDDLTLSWMIKRLKAKWEDFPVDDLETNVEPADELEKAHKEASVAQQHDPRQKFYRLWPRAYRSIGNVPVATRPFPILKPLGEINVGRDRHATVHREMVHVSAIERLGKSISIEHLKTVYAPENLVSVLPNILSGLIADNNNGQGALPTVDWNGEQIEPGTERAVAAAKLVKDFLQKPPARIAKAFQKTA